MIGFLVPIAGVDGIGDHGPGRGLGDQFLEPGPLVRAMRSMLSESSGRAASSSKNGAMSSHLALARAEGDGGRKTRSRWLLYPDDWGDPRYNDDLTRVTTHWPEPVKCRALLVLHADLQQRGFPQGASR